jgi:transposase
MRRQRRNLSEAEKIVILREHLIDKVPVSEVCDTHGLNPTLFYQLQKKLLGAGAMVFEQPRAPYRFERAKNANQCEAVRQNAKLAKSANRR